MVVCEGKTDYTYLKEAILWHKGDARVASNLIDIRKFPTKGNKGKGDHWGVDFIRHSKSANRFLDLHGGVDSLISFCIHHLERTKKYHASRHQSPVIVVVDNDKQSEQMWSFISGATNSAVKIDGSKAYHKVSDSLYVVPIPKPVGTTEDIYIELLFPKKWRNFELDGKKPKLVQKKKDKLKPDEYGKGEFADRVIRANRGSVDCSNFGPLLYTICDIIEGKAS